MSDEWTDEDDAMAAAAGLQPNHPVWTVITFMSGLDDLERYREQMSMLVTPESLPRWGDFTQIAEFIASIPDVGTGSRPNHPQGAPDVAYVKIMDHIEKSYIHQNEGRIIEVPAIATLVWSEEAGLWRLHDVGDYVEPEELPRPNPGIAPSY